MKRRFASIFLVLPILISFPPDAPSANVDVVLALDRSGSMKANDPRRDSVKGVALFAQLLNPHDRLALLSFAERAETLLPLLPLADARARARLAGLAESVAMNGSLTDFDAALRLAYEHQSEHSREPGNQRILVLFSDGRIDLGDEAANQAERAAIAGERIPQLKAAGIRVYGVAFSPKADLEFLRGLAEATGGQAFRADTPDDIYRVFVRLFEEADLPLTAPVKDNRVTVDANVHELKLLVGRESADEPIRLADPRGREIRESDPHPGMEWQRTPRFDRITIHGPEAGSWKVLGAGGEKKAYLASDLDLSVSLPALARVGEPVAVSARLTYQGQAVADPAILKDIRFTAAVLDDSGQVLREIELRPGAAGSGSPDALGSLDFTNAGSQRIRIAAENSGFRRGKEATIALLAAPRGAVTETAAPTAPVAAMPVAPAPPETERTQPSATPPALPAVAEKEIQMTALAKLVWINIGLFSLLGIAIGARWWWLRQRAAEPRIAAAEEPHRASPSASRRGA